MIRKLASELLLVGWLVLFVTEVRFMAVLRHEGLQRNKPLHCYAKRFEVKTVLDPTDLLPHNQMLTVCDT